MTRIGRFALVMAAVFGAVRPGSAAAQTCIDEPDDRAAVREVAEGIIAADNARDIEAVLSFYHPEAILRPPGAGPVRGRAEIRPRYEALFDGYDPAIVGEVGHIDLCATLAVVSGRNAGRMKGRDGRPDRPLNDAYVMVLRRESDRWTITRLISHPGG